MSARLDVGGRLLYSGLDTVTPSSTSRLDADQLFRNILIAILSFVFVLVIIAALYLIWWWRKNVLKPRQERKQLKEKQTEAVEDAVESKNKHLETDWKEYYTNLYNEALQRVGTNPSEEDKQIAEKEAKRNASLGYDMKDWKKADEQGTKDYKTFYTEARHRICPDGDPSDEQRKEAEDEAEKKLADNAKKNDKHCTFYFVDANWLRGADRVPPGGSIASDGRVLDASGQPVIDPTTGKPMIVDQNPKPEPRRNSIWKSIVAGANGLTLSRAPTSELPQTGQGNAQTPGSRFEAMEKKIKELEIDLKDDKGKKLVKLPEFRELLRWKKLIPLKLSNDDCVRHLYRREILVISHRWQTKEDPDPKGEQLREVMRYVIDNEDIKYVWFDYWCMPQGKRAPEEEVAFRYMLTHSNYLYLGCTVLILVDREYLKRFWTQFEAWVAMRKSSESGLVDVKKDEEKRWVIVAPTETNLRAAKKIKELLEESWQTTTVEDAEKTLNQDDIDVTNQKDKEIMLPKLKQLDVDSSEIFRKKGVFGIRRKRQDSSSKQTIKEKLAHEPPKDNKVHPEPTQSSEKGGVVHTPVEAFGVRK